MRRLDQDIAGWGDLGDIPRDVIMRNLQTAYKRPFAKKSGLESIKGEQMRMSLPEYGRVAKEQPILIDPWGESYFEVPTLFSSGGRV